MQPIEITVWQCPVCHTTYDDKDEAIACSSKPNPTPRFKVGDTVYLQTHYFADRSKTFVERNITEVCGVFKEWDGSHQVGYNLNMTVDKEQGGIGRYKKTNLEQEGNEPALEEDIYLIGDRRPIWDVASQEWQTQTLTTEMIAFQTKTKPVNN